MRSGGHRRCAKAARSVPAGPVAHQRLVFHAPPRHDGIEARKLSVGMARMAHDDMPLAGLAQRVVQLLGVGPGDVEVGEAGKAVVDRRTCVAHGTWRSPSAEQAHHDGLGTASPGLDPRERDAGARIADQAAGRRDSARCTTRAARTARPAEHARAGARRCGPAGTPQAVLEAIELALDLGPISSRVEQPRARPAP